MKRYILLLVPLLFLSMGTPSRNITVTGIVSDNQGNGLPGVNVTVKGTTNASVSDVSGNYSITVSAPADVLVFSFLGMVSQEIKIGSQKVINVVLEEDVTTLSEVVVTGYATGIGNKLKGYVRGVQTVRKQEAYGSLPSDFSNEEYGTFSENTFRSASENPLSTFSIDVDAASYSNIRRFINLGQKPPSDAVRIEEMINYFEYDYPSPGNEHPFNIITEIATSPWNKKHKLVQIALQGKRIPVESLPPSNLVFLIDVSGSMSDINKLPLLKISFKMLVEKLRDEDQVSIVVYAGAAGVVLKPTRGSQKERIMEAIDKLEAGGSTAGGEGIHLAYSLARQSFIDGGNNRVILATDGDFNVGVSDETGLEKLIEEKRKHGIYLTVLGYGMGNYKDSKMEILADKGNGNYAYIDNITEARKVLVNEFSGTLFTIAKDVKLQVEFNPANVSAYRLLGYENRLLKSEDFNNDKKDAGELGAGHTVTALYEIIPVGVRSDFYTLDDLKYQKTNKESSVNYSDEILTVKFRYKNPDELRSRLITIPVKNEGKTASGASENFRWAAAVAAFGMLLRDSPYIRDYSYEEVIQLAESARGLYKEGYRIEFINLVKSAGAVSGR